MYTVFLDRDGVINRNRSDYVKSWREFRFVPGSRHAIARLTEAGYRLIVVTNQACVGKGIVPAPVIEEIHQRMRYEVGLAGGRIEAVLCCTHHPEARCACRKPAPGLLYQAQSTYGVDLHRAVFVGDSANDMRAADAANVPSILVLSGLGLRTLRESVPRPLPYCHIALNLAHAARMILASNARAQRVTLWSHRAVADTQTA